MSTNRKLINITQIMHIKINYLQTQTGTETETKNSYIDATIC